MHLTVFGGTGSIGRHVVELAVDAGHDVTVLIRDPAHADMPVQVKVVAGDITDAAAVDEAVEGADAVIWTVGATANRPDQVETFEAGARNLVAAMQQHDVRRLVALSGAGITVDGERKPLGGRVMSAFVRLMVPHVVEAKRREYEVFKRSKLDWTLLRPPRVVPGPATGTYELGAPLRGSRVADAELARAMVDVVSSNRFVRQAPYVSPG